MNKQTKQTKVPPKNKMKNKKDSILGQSFEDPSVRYMIGKELGHGGFGVVKECVDKKVCVYVYMCASVCVCVRFNFG